MPLKKTGVRLVAENERGFLGALEKANKSVADLGATSSKTGTVGLLALSAGIAVVVAIATKAVQVVSNLVNKIIEAGKSSILTAARWDELRLVAQLLGQRAGLTADEVDSLSASIQDQGIRADVASKQIAQMVRYNLDLSRATELAAAAQNVAVLAGQDSSETLDNLIYGITTYNKRVLRTQGLNIDVKGSFKGLADSLDKSVESLSEAEKVQAVFNATLIEAQKLTGVYDLAMENAGKQLRSLTGREIPELSAAFGSFFQPAFLTAVKTAREFVSNLKDMISEGGRLYPLLVRVGAIASLLADGLARLAGIATEQGASFLENFGNKMIEAAEKALRWGVDIAINLGDGLIKGAASAIVAAMNYISSLLESWLAPGSPPKVAPDIIKWGKRTMEEYLKGWQLADFTFFDKITGLISSYIRSLPGLIGDQSVNVIPRILGARKAVTEAINSMQRTGEVTESAINRIVKAVGGANQIFRNYIRAYFLAEAATYRFEKAQEELVKANENVKRIQGEISEITDKYNSKIQALNKQLGRQSEILDENQRLAKIQKALSSGLLTEEEKARLEAEKADIQTRQQIRKLEDQRDKELEIANTKLNAALEEQKAIEARLSQLEAEKNSAMELLALQEAMIKAQTDQNNLLKSQAELLKRLADQAKEGGGADVGDAFSGLDGAFEKARNRIFEAIEAAKQRIIETMGEIFAPIREKWDTEWKPIFDELLAKWNRFEIDVLTIWYRLFGPERGIITSTFKSAGEKIKEIWEETIWPAMQTVYDWMTGELFPFLQDFDYFLDSVWLVTINNIKDAWGLLLDNYLRPLWDFLSSNLGPYIENSFIPNVLDPLLEFINNIAGGLGTALNLFSELGEKLRGLADRIRNMPSLSDYIHQSPSPLELGLMGINKQLRQLSQIELPRLNTGINSIQKSAPMVGNRSVQYITNNNSTNVQVDPTYTSVQSPSGIFYDVHAALQASRM